MLWQLPLSNQTCWGAEQVVLRFVDTPHTSHSLVRLSDLVEVLDGHSPSLEQMLSMPMGPSPRIGQPQRWHSSDVLQHLELRGIHPASIRWSGANETDLQRSGQLTDDQAESLTPAFVDERIIRQAKQNVRQAIHEYLNLRNSERIDWRIEVEIPDNHVELLRNRRSIASIGGGAEPWPGEQQFVLQVRNRETLMSLPIRAVVELPPMVVTSSRAIRREEILTEESLTYASLPSGKINDQARTFTKIEDCVGKQVRRSISAGLAITEDFVGDPIVVNRHDLVEVESVSGAIVARSSAKALGSGAVGDLVEIEMPTRHRLHATVVGQSVVRISAVSARATRRR